MPRCRDLVIFVVITDDDSQQTELITLPLAHACRVTMSNALYYCSTCRQALVGTKFCIFRPIHKKLLSKLVLVPAKPVTLKNILSCAHAQGIK